MFILCVFFRGVERTCSLTGRSAWVVVDLRAARRPVWDWKSDWHSRTSQLLHPSRRHSHSCGRDTSETLPRKPLLAQVQDAREGAGQELDDSALQTHLHHARDDVSRIPETAHARAKNSICAEAGRHQQVDRSTPIIAPILIVMLQAAVPHGSGDVESLPRRGSMS